MDTIARVIDMKNQSFVCEFEFEDEDINNPGYSMCEMDFYGWIPTSKQNKNMENHRLTLWKNLITGEYEVIRHYHAGRDEVIYKNVDFQAVLDVITEQRATMHNIKEILFACKHNFPLRSEFCKAEKHEQRKKLVNVPDSLIKDLKKIKDDLVSFSSGEVK